MSEEEPSHGSNDSSSDRDLRFDFGLREVSSPSSQPKSSSKGDGQPRPESIHSTEKVREIIEEDERANEVADDRSHQLRHLEDMFWASMAPDDAKKMKGMLHAVSAYQEHFRHNEDTITDLHSNIETKERVHRTTRRRVQQVGQEMASVQDQSAVFQEELDRWMRKSGQYADRDVDLGALHTMRATLQEKRIRLTQEVVPHQAELVELQQRVLASEAMHQEQASRLQMLEAKCLQTVATIEAEQSAELSFLRLQHEEELPRWQSELDGKVSDLRARHDAEAAHLRATLAETQRNTERLAVAREEALEHLAVQQLEGSRLQRRGAEAREEVLDLAAQVRAYQEVPRVASQLGMSLDGSMASIEFLPLPGEDPELDIELQAVRQQCKALERECQRTQDALDRKQAECERWRKRALEQRDRDVAKDLVAPAALSPGPFMLGPQPGDAEDGVAVRLSA